MQRLSLMMVCLLSTVLSFLNHLQAIVYQMNPCIVHRDKKQPEFFGWLIA